MGIISLHSKGIIHNDLGAENIIYDHETKTLKIIDFGLAQMVKCDEGCIFDFFFERDLHEFGGILYCLLDKASKSENE